MQLVETFACMVSLEVIGETETSHLAPHRTLELSEVLQEDGEGWEVRVLLV